LFLLELASELERGALGLADTERTLGNRFFYEERVGPKESFIDFGGFLISER
jgi:hypothetical protein